MSFNPFDSQLLPYGADLAQFDREMDFLDLDSKCCGQRILSYRYISPRGMGKTTLLEAYFSYEKCRELAQERKQLVCICRFSGDEMQTDAAVFACLIDAVEESLKNLGVDSAVYGELFEKLTAIQTKHPDYKSDPEKGKDLLEEMLEYLSARRYFVTLVLDEFHQLACAGNLAKATFSKMAKLGQKKLISYIVASDYDDEVGSENYYISPFARIFANDTTHLAGIVSPAGKRAMMKLIRDKLSRFQDVRFTDEELQLLIELTGGIPGLLRAALKDIFEIKQEAGSELNTQELTAYALSACTPLMAKWVQYFDDARWETMAAVIEGVTEDAIKTRLAYGEDKRTSLADAGLIVKNLRQREYRLICPLFESYVRDELPRRRKEIEPAVCWEPQHIENHYHLAAGTKLVQGDDNSQNLMAQNVQIQNGMTVADVLQILGDGSGDTRELFASRLSEQLRKNIPAEGVARLPRSEFETQEAYEQSYDQAFDSYSQSVVQDVEEDEEKDLIVTPAAMQTLDERFAQARSRCRSALTDRILAEQSERCQFYLKLSVVVEDALDLPGIQMEDYSPQLVLYGKALEQSLRDNFYELFHKDPTLSAYNTYTNTSDRYAADVFANKAVRQTFIGNYVYLIAAQKAYLASLCLTNPVRTDGQPGDAIGWEVWWDRLQTDAYDARSVRNLADHADPVSPTRQNLDQMCDMLFGTAAFTGILPRTVVGKQLCQELFPPRICFDVGQKFVGNTCRMRCTAVKPNGGLKGVTCEGSYPVNISAKRVLAYCVANNYQSTDFTGKELLVKVLEAKTQNDKDFFAAEIVSTEIAAQENAVKG